MCSMRKRGGLGKRETHTTMLIIVYDHYVYPLYKGTNIIYINNSYLTNKPSITVFRIKHNMQIF